MIKTSADKDHIMEQEFLRYSCQLVLPGFGMSNQLKLQQSKVLIVGAGGLGCPAAQYLVAAGIGTLGIADHDIVSILNLHRQILFTPADIGFKKSLVAFNKLRQQNPQIAIMPHDVRVGSENVMSIIGEYDIVVDCTDNFETRYLLNDACVLSGKPLVYGAIYQYEGQVAIWNILNTDGSYTPNYRDIFPEVDASQVPNCAEGGVIPTIAGIIGCMQANEVIKYITGTGELLSGKILILDAQTLQSRIIKLGTVTKTHISSLQKTTIIPVISVKEVKKKINDNSCVLVDVRNVDERETFNIGGLHIPINEIETDTSYLNSGKAVVFYCASGNRSAEAVKIISKKFPGANIFSLEGGIKAWKQQE